jgi:hypothetical protein
MSIPKLQTVSKEESMSMTPNEKRMTIIQFKQEDTMFWQKLVCQIQVVLYCISIISVMVYFLK